jgi:putative ABC transport system permease protein
VISLRLAIDLTWLDRVQFVDGAAPEAWVAPDPEAEVDPEAEPEDTPVEIALSTRAAAAMGVAAGDVIEVTFGTLRVAGVYEPLDESDIYWAHAFDLQRATEIRESGMPPKIQASAYVAPETILGLPDAFVTGILSVWIPVDASAYSYADLETLGTQTRNLIASPQSLPDFGQVNLGTSMPVLLDEVKATVSATSALIALAASGLLGVLVATYALSIQALVRRRRPALSLGSARGASLRQLRTIMVLEAALIALPGSALAIVAASLVLPERIGLDGWLAPVILALTPVALAAILVAPGNLREERQDLAVRSRAPLRWVLEAAVVGAAVVSLVLLQRRGLVASSDIVGIDPLLAATPLLVAASVGLLTLRLYPIPVRAARRMVRRRTAPVWEVGSARAIREPAIGAIATLALVVGVSIVVFTTVMVSTVGLAMLKAAEEEVGADMQVAAHDLPDSLVDEIRAVPGVEGAVALTTRAGLTLLDEAGSLRISVVLVEPEALAAVRPDLPELPRATGNLPILVSEQLAAQLQGTALQLEDNPATAVGEVPDTAIPGMSGLWLITDRAAADALGLEGQIPSRLLIALVDDYERSTVTAVTDLVLVNQPEQFADSARFMDVTSELGRSRSAPITLGLETSLLIVAGASLVLTMLVVALASAASAGSRNRVVGILRILGMNPRQVRALVGWEFGPVAVASVLVGTAVGVGLPFLVTAVLDLRGFFGGTTLPQPVLDPVWIAVAVGIYGLAIAVTVLVSSAFGRRFAPASTLKMGES